MTVRRSRRLTAVVGLAALLSAVSASGTAPALAQLELAFEGVGDATGLIATATNPTIPAGIVIEGSGPTSQARLTSLGTSTAFAALPFPGETAAGLPGVVSALTGIPLPEYPLFIRSESGTEAKSARFPGASLEAESTGNRSASRATAATDASGYFAETVVAQDKDGAVTVRSEARQNGVSVGGVMTLSNVVSSAAADLDISGKTSLRSSLAVGRFTAPSLQFTVPAQACIPGQQCVPVPAPFAGVTLSNPNLGLDADGFFITLPIAGPQKFPVPAAAVFDAFKAIGVTATYQEELRTKTSVVAPTLALSTVLPALPANEFFNGPTPVTYTLGRTAASISGQVTDTGVSIDLPVLPPSFDASPVGTDTTGSPGSDGSAVDIGAAPVLPGTDLAPTTGAVPSSQGSNASPTLTPVLANSPGAPRLPSAFWFYLVLVGVGLVGSAAAHLTRYLGVRASWTS